jgi:hypothetical protein
MAGRAGVILGALVVAHAAAAQYTQQGSKLVGVGAVGPAHQGYSVAVSADGNTAIVGGPYDDSGAGAAWVFTRSGGQWSQEGGKLVGSGAAGIARFGKPVAISADGNTVVIGGPYDGSHTGAAWVFTRSGGAWSQVGSPLVGTGAVGATEQGWSAAISADGNTVIVGGPFDASNTGAAWVYTRDGTEWSQQGNKLVGTGASGYAAQGYSVAISADGNTALVGGVADRSFVGAVWVFTRSDGVWSQEGSKLTGSDAVGRAFQGYSVAISTDGNTAVIGGYGDDSTVGAAWVFTRSGGVWSQQGSKLVGTGATGSAAQGWSVSVAADGNTAVEGATSDDYNAGAAWVFARSGGAWSQIGGKLVGTGAVGAESQGAVAISADGATVIAGGSYDDVEAGAAWVFVTSACKPPSIVVPPQSRTVASGQIATLSVIAAGTGELGYQWYQGDAGDTLTPVGGDASTLTTPPLTATASFWVHVTGACGNADSAAATVTIGQRVRQRLYRAP